MSWRIFNHLLDCGFLRISLSEILNIWFYFGLRIGERGGLSGSRRGRRSHHVWRRRNNLKRIKRKLSSPRCVSPLDSGDPLKRWFYNFLGDLFLSLNKPFFVFSQQCPLICWIHSAAAAEGSILPSRRAIPYNIPGQFLPANQLWGALTAGGFVSL